MSDITVSAIATTPVKGLALHARERVELSARGVSDNRRFFLVDAARKLVNAKRVGKLMAVRAELDHDGATLTLQFPDGTVVSEAIETRDAVEVRAFSTTSMARPACPALSGALSEFAGRALTLVEADPTQTANDRGADGAVSLLSAGSVAQLEKRAGEPVDPRRFRMLLHVDGLEAHAEDALVGHDVRVGSALVRFEGHIGRCRVTSMDPDTGQVTLPTLDLLGYRKGLATTEPLAFGIYGAVLEPGWVSVGDTVAARLA